jgi:hypothetical protein
MKEPGEPQILNLAPMWVRNVVSRRSGELVSVEKVWCLGDEHDIPNRCPACRQRLAADPDVDLERLSTTVEDLVHASSQEVSALIGLLAQPPAS